MVIKLNINNLHHQYSCAKGFVQCTTSIPFLTKINNITLCLLRDCTIGIGPEKIPYSKKQAKGTTLQRMTLDNLENVLFLMLQKYHDPFSCNSFQISTENTYVCYNHLPSSISCDALNIHTIITPETYNFQWMTD